MRDPQTSAAGAAIKLEDLRFAYPGGARMRFDLELAAGDIAALMGPSGSGKSSLLGLIAGIETPESGTIAIGGADLGARPPHRRPVSMVFQENNLFAHLSVADNVGLGRSPSLALDAADRAAVAEALARTGLDGKEARLPPALSGGERRRVALARVLVRARPVLLLDEAFSSLGPALRGEMLDLIARLHAEHGMTILMATHDPRDAERLARTVVYVEDGAVCDAGPAAGFLAGTASRRFNRYLGSRGD